MDPFIEDNVAIDGITLGTALFARCIQLDVASCHIHVDLAIGSVSVADTSFVYAFTAGR